MAYSAMEVANSVIKKAENGGISGLTPMKLQKLLFFAQSWYLKKHGMRLIDDNFARWKFGPVIPSIYYEFSAHGSDVINSHARDSQGQVVEPNLRPEDDSFLNEIIGVYGNYSGWMLSDMSHQNGTAWSMGYIGSVITDGELSSGAV